jgi:lipoate-protein ligase B
MDYCRGWAWQQIILTQRLAARKNPQSITNNKIDSKDNQDVDSILILEHAPVYTLGRGANEEHLRFLNNNNNNHDKENDHHHDCHHDARSSSIREKLSRTYRGHDSARLILQDRKALEIMLQQQQQQSTSHDATVTNLLARVAATPVLAPNGVPIYRVDRGGEVTFHGPSQLVVYPLLDLKQVPFQADLHWFLRQLEEVVIQTLRHYGIEGTRDDINSGKEVYKSNFFLQL